MVLSLGSVNDLNLFYLAESGVACEEDHKQHQIPNQSLLIFHTNYYPH